MGLSEEARVHFPCQPSKPTHAQKALLLQAPAEKGPKLTGDSKDETLESACCSEHWTTGKVTPRDTGLVPTPAAGGLDLDPNPGYLVLF